LVIGDLIVDEYVLCDPLGMSQEDPSIVVTPVSNERFVGGAGIVSMHASQLGSRTSFIAVAGDDTVAEFALEGLGAANVKAHILKDDSRPTTLKQRFRASGKTLLRVSHLSQIPISTSLQDQILNEIEREIHDLDLVIFSDFNLGSLPQSLVNRVTMLCRTNGIMMVADSQSSSQIGDISRFSGMRMIAPTEREARIALRNSDDGLVVLSEKLRGLANVEDILLTLGSDGVLVYSPESESDLITDKLAAINPNPVDVAGAGDSMFVAAALTLASGGSIWEAAAIGSVAAAIQVSRLGNLPLNVDELTSAVAG
jgi:rfaE bifunctional protein kinase chain/domain